MIFWEGEMTIYQNKLLIDFCEVGFRNSKHRFCVLLDALLRDRPWFDVQAINTPAWAAEVLARQTVRTENLWRPWIETSQRAKGMRPRLL